MNSQIKRPGADLMKTRIEVPADQYFYMKQKNEEDYFQYIAERLKRNLGEKVADLLQNGDYACGKFKKNEYRTTNGDINEFHTHSVIFQEEMIFRPFTFCKDCCEFIREESNGGICPKRNEFVHITDGCTLGEKKIIKAEWRELSNAETDHDD